jgi:LmbE family N-acetylglucosaminyl deacetylase
VSADKALVIAPHFDDDVLGCGGLIAQLTAAGSGVAVLFLTDGSGGDEEIENRQAYAERRHGEAIRGLEILGVDDVEFLDLPDGSLATHLDEASAGIRRALIERRPDLLLAVSPIEISTDHRAAFAALYAVLAPLRGGTDLDAAVADLDILLYEANRPAFPDVLVDVSAEIDLVRQAIDAHESQLELHNYREWTLGLRSLRTVSLPPEVKAAEGYRRLSVRDFTTHSQAGLIRSAGGVPELHEITQGPLISVVVRTKDRPELLAEALASLAAGSYRRVEVVLVNDGGAAPAISENFPFPVVRVDIPENRGRSAAANAGVEAATGEWVAFLDDDDLAEPEHLATLAGLSEASDVRVAYTDTAVGIYELDPDRGWREVERRLPYSRDFDPDLLLFDNYIPFNTLLIERELFDEVGPFDTSLPFFEDWDFLIRLAARTQFHHLAAATAEYRHFRSGGHHVFGERPDQRADFLAVKAKVIAKHGGRHSPEILARVVGTLRAETVAAQEAAAARAVDAQLQIEKERSESVALREVIEAERDALRGEHDAVCGERDALADELQSHRSALRDHEENIQNLFIEIQRLNAIIENMEGTKAWKLHRAAEKLRGR